jgi:hypothetical protein
VNRRIVLPQFIDARAFPAAPGFGARLGLEDQVWKVGSGKGGHRFAMALEPEAGFQFIGHQLEIGRFLERDEVFEKLNGLGRPIRPVVAARELGGELGTFLEEARTEPVKMGATDPQKAGGISGVNSPCIELVDDLLEKQGGETLGDLLFL